jgi:arylformamidase
MRAVTAFLLCCILGSGLVTAQEKIGDLPYRQNGHKRHVLDIYRPRMQSEKPMPVVFWIHGGGWQAGDKSDVGMKPAVVTARGMIFVSTNYRLLPDVTMEELTDDVAAALGWVHNKIADFGGDPNRIIVGGHSAGAQLAALLCTDSRYAEKYGVSLQALIGCIPVDGDTYDIPKIIMTAELRQMLYGGKMFTFGHRQKFGDSPEKHVDFSAVTHVAPNRSIPPFLLLYFTGNPDTTAQAQRLAQVLENVGISARAFGKSDTNHSQLNDDLGNPEDPATKEFFAFFDRVLK